MDAGSKVADQVVAIAHGKGDQRHGAGLVGLCGKDAGVTDIEVGDIVSLSPLVGDGSFGIVAHAADTDFVQAGAGAIGLGIGAPEFAVGGFEEIDHHFFGVFPHQEFVFSPFIVEAELRDPEDIFFAGIDVHVVRRAGQARRLNIRANGGGIVALDVAFVFGAEAFELRIVAGEQPPPT